MPMLGVADVVVVAELTVGVMVVVAGLTFVVVVVVVVVIEVVDPMDVVGAEGPSSRAFLIEASKRSFATAWLISHSITPPNEEN